MIIIEGPDGSGKTTTIEKLGFTRLHTKSMKGGVGGSTPNGWAGPGILSPVAAYARRVREVQQMVGVKIAFDRFHLSEQVYGPILRNEQLIDEMEMTIITHMLRDKQIPVILCLPPFDVTLANVMKENRERPEYQTEAFLRHAYERFQRVACWATHVYDYTKDPLPGFVDHAIVRVNGD